MKILINMSSKKDYRIVSNNQEEFLRQNSFFKNNHLIIEGKKPYLTTAIMWIEKNFNVLFVTDMIGYQFLTIVKKDNIYMFHSGFQKSSDDAKSTAFDMFIKQYQDQ